jgi:hypothetical protein
MNLCYDTCIYDIILSHLDPCFFLSTETLKLPLFVLTSRQSGTTTIGTTKNRSATLTVPFVRDRHDSRG